VIRRFLGKRSLEHSLAISVGLLVTVLIGTTMLLVHSRVAASLRKEMGARGFSIARSIGAVATPSLLAYNYAALQIAADGASGDDGVVYVIIHDKEGEVAGVAGRSGFAVEPRVPPAVPLSRQVDVGTGTVLELAMPVLVEGVDEPWGLVRVGLSYEPVAAELRRIDARLSLFGLALAICAVACGRLIARRITAPLRRLAEGTEALAAGDTSHRIPVVGPREIAELAGAFNSMMDRLRAKAEESTEFQRALEKLNATLEEQVHERTRALQESEAQYKTLVEHSPDSILIVQDGRVRFVNKAFVETFGVSEAQACSGDFDLDLIFDPSSAALARGRIAAWERGESMSSVEVLGKDGSGRIRHLELRGSRIEYRGTPCAECLLIDMTEARRLRERLSEAEKLRALGELASGVAHDFNNLLGAILGRAQLMRRRKLGAEADRELAVIEKAALDGRETVRRIQEFSRVRRDRQFSRVDLAEIVRDSVEITRGKWRNDTDRRNVTTRIAVNVEGNPAAIGNASELREVFTNLILNAVDAMPQGGKIELTCRQSGDKVRAIVRDDDAGFGGSKAGTRLLAHEIPDDPLLHVADIDRSLLEVLVLDAADRFDESVNDPLERRGRVESFASYGIRGAVDEHAIVENKKVRVEDPGVIVAHTFGNVGSERTNLARRVVERPGETRDLPLHRRRRNRPRRHGIPIGVANERGTDDDARGCGNAAARDFRPGTRRPGGGAVGLIESAAWHAGVVLPGAGVVDSRPAVCIHEDASGQSS